MDRVADLGREKASTCTPNGIRGKRLKSAGPCMASYADMSGLVAHVRRMLRVMRVCGMRSSHNMSGKLGSVVHKVDMK